MKRSELQQLVREQLIKKLSENAEMDKMNQALNVKVGVKPVDPSVKNTMKYESLPGYDALPATRKDIDFKNRKSIVLPSNIDSNVDDSLMSKEEVKKWYNEFVAKFKEQPQFKVEGNKIKVLNGLKPDWDFMKTQTQGD